jgi:hypothetical protein
VDFITAFVAARFHFAGAANFELHRDQALGGLTAYHWVTGDSKTTIQLVAIARF